MFSSRIKDFIWKYQIVLACSTFAVTTYIVVQDVNAKETLKDMTLSVVALNDENVAMQEFLDRKSLRDEFVEFVKNNSNST